MSDSVLPKPKKQFTDLPEAEQREIILGAAQDSNDAQRKIMDSVLPTSPEPNFTVTIESPWDMDGSLQGKSNRVFTITVDEDSDEQTSYRFAHELNEFIRLFCEPDAPTWDELALALVTTQSKDTKNET